MDVKIRLIEGADAIVLSGRVWPCYDAVFGDFEDAEVWRMDMFERHAQREGFRLVLAEAGEEVVGFSWGYVGERGQYWSELLADALPAAVVDEWVGGHFEVVELAVLPSWRRAGLGQQLHDRLLAGIVRQCLLSTSEDESDPAVRLYQRAGWRQIGILRPGVQVMGRLAPNATW